MKLVKWLKNEIKTSRVLFRSIPGITLGLFLIATVIMNILASVALVNESWIALDAGILVSFIGFIFSDMIVKRFGAKAAVRTTVLGFIVNILIALLLTAVAFIAKATGEYYPLSDYASLTQWWIIGASAAAFLVSGILNAGLHHLILKPFKKNRDGLKAHAISAWGSTFVGQAVDNLIFGLIFTFPASLIGLWGMTPVTILGLAGFAISGGIVELLCQILFTPLGFRIAESWRKNDVGREYLDLIKEQ